MPGAAAAHGRKTLLHFRHFRHPWRSDAGSNAVATTIRRDYARPKFLPGSRMFVNRFIFAAVAIAASASCQAAVCDATPSFEADNGLSVVAPEMRVGISAGVGQYCVSAQAYIDRIRATVVVTPTGGSPDAATYVPQTKFDNTPWRFDMNQNGKRMTAAEFDAWMKAKGIHVATGKPAAQAQPPTEATPDGQ